MHVLMFKWLEYNCWIKHFYYIENWLTKMTCLKLEVVYSLFSLKRTKKI